MFTTRSALTASLSTSQHSRCVLACCCSRAVELFHAQGGLFAAQAHAAQELSDPLSAGTDVESLCVQPFVHQAPDRHPTEAQNV